MDEAIGGRGEESWCGECGGEEDWVGGQHIYTLGKRDRGRL